MAGARIKKSRGGKAAPEAGSGWTRERVKRHLVQRFYTRFHMSLILGSSAMTAMLVNWLLLHGGMHAMWLRYPIALSTAYLAFMTGVWLWLRYAGFVRDASTSSSLVDGGDIGNFPVPGGSGPTEFSDAVGGSGGQFGGGGASGSWGGDTPLSASSSGSSGSSGSSSSGGSSLMDGIDIDGEGLVLLVLALLLIASIFILSGYAIWFAPEILTEAAFGAALAGGLAKRAKSEDSSGWIGGVIAKTWWLFGIVLVAAMAFAIFATVHYPQAATFGQAVSLALHS